MREREELELRRGVVRQLGLEPADLDPQLRVAEAGRPVRAVDVAQQRRAQRVARTARGVGLAARHERRGRLDAHGAGGREVARERESARDELAALGVHVRKFEEVRAPARAGFGAKRRRVVGNLRARGKRIAGLGERGVGEQVGVERRLRRLQRGLGRVGRGRIAVRAAAQQRLHALLRHPALGGLDEAGAQPPRASHAQHLLAEAAHEILARIVRRRRHESRLVFEVRDLQAVRLGDLQAQYSRQARPAEREAGLASRREPALRAQRVADRGLRSAQLLDRDLALAAFAPRAHGLEGVAQRFRRRVDVGERLGVEEADAAQEIHARAHAQVGVGAALARDHHAEQARRVAVLERRHAESERAAAVCGMPDPRHGGGKREAARTSGSREVRICRSSAALARSAR